MELKDPLGELWIGDVFDNVRRLEKYLCEVKPILFATVGDYVSYHILEADIHPDIVVIDHRIMREDVKPIEFDRKYVNVSNESGTISEEAQKVLYEAVQQKKTLAVIVDGEEDLLVLPLMAYMPPRSVIIYGQPREGMVVINLDEERSNWAIKFMSGMRRKSDNP